MGHIDLPEAAESEQIIAKCLDRFGYPPTDEQVRIVWDAVHGRADIIKILAFAGTGKTSTLKMLAYSVAGQKLYLAFNRSIADEASAAFEGTDTIVKTTHALAYQYVIRNGGYKIKGGYSAREIADILDCSYKSAALVREELERFFNSADLDFPSGNEEKFSFARMNAIRGAKKIYAAMLRGEIPFSQSASLKTFHLGLASGEIQIRNRYSLLMLDEGQDTNSVTLAIFYLIPAKKRVIVGDRHQQIYSFRGSVNAMSMVKGSVSVHALTRSFRFPPEIGERATSFLSLTRGEKLPIVGAGKPSGVRTTVHISRRNSTLIRKITGLISQKIRFRTVRDPWSIFGLAINLIKLSRGEPLDAEFRYLSSFTREVKGAKTSLNLLRQIVNIIGDPNDEIVRTIKLIFDIPGIEEAYRAADRYFQMSVDEFDLFLTTAHTAKGLEWDSVEVLDDFVGPEIIGAWFFDKRLDPRRIIGDDGEPVDALEFFAKKCNDPKYVDELNLYYVAITRTRSVLKDKSPWRNLVYDRDGILSEIAASYRALKKIAESKK